MRVIMTGGGTGGHIYPAIAIAEEIKKRHPDAEIIFAGTTHGMEKDIVPANGYELRYITVSGLDRRNPLKNFKTAKDLMKGMAESKKLMKECKPDVVIGTGGYVCGPVVRAAAQTGIRSFIHEQNAFPGLTNKLLSKKVETVFTAFEEAVPYFKTKKPVITVGNPVRSAFAKTSRDEARKALGLSEDEFVVLSFGGSLGAQTINDQMQDAVRRFAGKDGIRIIFATGKRYYDRITGSAENIPQNVTYMRYIDDMPIYLAACDLAVTRAGALTVSEIMACGRASIMIPSPNVTANHQYYNAKSVADKNAAILIEEKNLAEGTVADVIERMADDRSTTASMSENAAKAGRIDAAKVICDTIGI